MSSTTATLSADFKVIHKTRSDKPGYTYKEVYLCASPEFLREKWEVIASYARKIEEDFSPRQFALLTSSEMETELLPFKLESEDREISTLLSIKNAGLNRFLEKTLAADQRLRLKYESFLKLEKERQAKLAAVRISDLFPRILKAIYGGVRGVATNCHGIASVAGGLFPALSTSIEPRNLHSAATQIPLDELASGDIVCLPKHSDHSFIFLDHDICFSANGAYEPLLLHSTSQVLKIYNCDIDILKQIKKESKHSPKAEKAQQVTTYRKKDSWNLPKRLIDPVIELYEILNSSFNNSRPGDPLYGAHLKAFEKIKGIKTDKISELTDTENSAYKILVLNFWL